MPINTLFLLAIRPSFVSALSSTFIKREVKTGLITKATKSEEERTIIKVIGKYFKNSPMIPGQINSGIKAAKVVAVEAIIGKATSPVPYLAAS